MHMHLKLILPSLLILSAAATSALWPASDHRAALPSALALAAAVVLLAQGLASERWVHGALRAIRAALAGEPPPPVHSGEWRDVVDRIAGLQAATQEEQTARRQAADHSRRIEEALQASEERYVQAVRGAQDGLWECDLGARCMLLSPRWRHMLGLPDEAQTLSLDAWRDRLHPEDRHGAVNALDEHLASRTDRFEHVHRLLHSDGRYRWVLSRGTALRRASGTAYRVVGMDTDITKPKRVEAIVDAIAKGTAGQSGEPFFHALVQHFARALHVQCAFITECLACPATRVRTLAFWHGSGFEENFEYDLAGTPCEEVMREGRTVFHPQGLAQQFPCEVGHESYLGLPIIARDGLVIGHLAFLDHRPMPGDIIIETVYRIFTARAAVEIELGRALQRLKTACAPASVGVRADP
jgi:PAS domain S-box-containing protein